MAEEILRRELRNLLENLTPHLYLFGTAGEGYAVTERQFDQVVRVFREETIRTGELSAPHGQDRAGDPSRPNTAMVGLISLSLPTMIERIERARDMGIRHFQISLPSWGALSDGELNTFFAETCGRFLDCSFLHYNLLRTKRIVTPEEYAVLADKYPNLVATKNSTDSMERILGLMTKAPQLQHFFTETGYAYGSQLGECGFLISVASVHFEQAKRYFEAGRRQELEMLRQQQRELSQMITDIVALGRGEAHMDGAFDKVFCRIHDPEFPLRLLPPYGSLSEDTFRKIVNLIREKYPRWSRAA